MPTPVDIGEGILLLFITISSYNLSIMENIRTIEIVNVVKERP